jgi:hypothetical protein
MVLSLDASAPNVGVANASSKRPATAVNNKDPFFISVLFFLLG